MRPLIDTVAFTVFMAAGCLLGAAALMGHRWVTVACAAVVVVAWLVGRWNVATGTRNRGRNVASPHKEDTPCPE